MEQTKKFFNALESADERHSRALSVASKFYDQEKSVVNIAQEIE
jgi:hypothetical protein